jgi:hypothetical protein
VFLSLERNEGVLLFKSQLSVEFVSGVHAYWLTFIFNGLIVDLKFREDFIFEKYMRVKAL